jgi:hypothetical protein
MANSVGTLAAFKDWGTGKTDIPYSSAAAGSMLHFLACRWRRQPGCP